ncbi:MAG: ABC transporter ATP-binding protein [Clostridiales bacterium]|nr:ABC transporter ATP-binding protein [Clostridiales bacterium]
MELIEYRNVCLQYEKGRPVINNVSFALEEGSITAFLGPNGSGKTTLMSALNRLITPFEGDVFIDGKNVKSIPLKKLATMIACVPQFSSPSFAYSVYNMILWGRAPYISYMPKPRDYQIVDETIERFQIAHLKDKPFSSISGGEKQMVLIARAIAQKTPIVLMDEPTTYLDIKNQIKILNVIRDINKSDGATFAITLHDPNHALYLADNIVMVNGGGAVKGKTDELMTENNIEKLYNVKSSFMPLYDMRYMTVDYRN